MVDPSFFADREPGTSGTSKAGDEDAFVCRRYLVRQQRRRPGVRRSVLALATLGLSLVIMTLLAVAFGVAGLRHGAFAIDVKPQVLAALNGRVGSAYRFDVGATSVGLSDAGPALKLDGLSVTDSAARPIVTAPQAAVAVNLLDLLVGKVSPTRLDIHDVDLRLIILPDGQVAVSAGANDAAAVPLSRAFGTEGTPASVIPESGGAPTALPPLAPVGASPPAPANAALQALAAAMRTLVDTATAAQGPLSALQQVNVTGRIVLDDRSRGTQTSFDDAVLSFSRAADGAAVLNVAADDAADPTIAVKRPPGRWSLNARASAASDGTRTLSVEASDLSLDEITLAGGLHGIGFDFDMPVSAKVDVALGANGAIGRLGGTFDLGAGYFRLDDPDHEPMLIDSISGAFHLDPTAKAVLIDKMQLQGGGTHFATKGRVDLPKGADDPWAVKLDSSGAFGAERPGEKPIEVDDASLALRLFPAQHRFVVDRVRVTGPDIDFDDAAEILSGPPGVHIHNVATVRNMPAPILVRLWPSFVAAKVRAWLLANLKDGTIGDGTATADFDGDDLKQMHVDAPVADSHVRVTFDASGLALNVMAGVPPLTALDASGTVTGHTFTMTVRHGEMAVAPGRRLTLADGDFRIPDTTPKVMAATVQAHVLGGVDVLADLLSRDALKPYASLPLDPATLKGQFDGHLTLGLKLGDDVPPGQATIAADATATNLAIEKLVGKEGLTDATIKLELDKGALHAKGDGRILGAPATIDLRKPASGPGEAVVSLALDDAARARAGFGAGGVLKGVVGAKVTAPIASGEKMRAAVDLDFTKASIDGPFPGFSKPMGKPGRATLTVVPRDGGTSLDDIAFDAGSVSIKGSASLDKDGGLASAKFSQVKLSPGDDMRLDVQTGDVTKISARGANLDARPFLKWINGAGTNGSGDDSKAAIDLDLHSGVLSGYNNQAMTGVDFRLSRRGGRTTRVVLAAHLGRQPVSIATTQIDNFPHLNIKAGDAGATLLFLDLYKRMAGGQLDAQVGLTSPTRLDGYIAVHEFTLREDPALRKLAAEGLASRNRETPNPDATSSTVDPSALTFHKLEATFTKTGNDIDVRDGSMFGPTLGATISGRIDFAHDDVNLSGTFVPLYGVNNLFSQVPLLGPLLGGGRHEGLLGLNYRITGSAANPSLSVNPFSALTPGFLREIFGAFDPTSGGLPGIPRDRAPTPGTPVVEQE